MSKKPIAVMSMKLINNSNQIKKLASIQAIALLMFSMASVILLPTKALATSSYPSVSAGANITGQVGVAIPIPGLSVSYSGDSSTFIPVKVSVTVGSLGWNESVAPGLQTGYDSDTSKEFTGTLEMINSVLGTFTYTAAYPGSATLSVQIGGNGYSYNSTNGHYYKRTIQGVDWATAKSNSEGMTYFGIPGYLASIDSAQENQFVLENNLRLYGSYYSGWIGASDAAEEGIWKWQSGPQAGNQFWQGGPASGGGTSIGGLYSNWGSSEPNNSSGIENCSEMMPWNDQGYWNDVSCTDTIYNTVTEFGLTGTAYPAPSTKYLTISTSYPATNTTNVSDCSKLADIAADPGTYQYDTINVMDNIDCGGDTIAPLFEYATPFKGAFNGNNHTISNFVINNPSDSCIGLFRNTDGANLNDLNIADATITASNYVGSLVGCSINSNITNINSQANVVGQSGYTGGIVGNYEGSYGSSVLSNNTFSGNISSGNTDMSNFGGIVGYVYGYNNSFQGFDISNNTFDGTIDTLYGYNVGGIAGQVENDNDYSLIKINSNNSSGTVGYSYDYIGGVVGYVYCSKATNYSCELVSNSVSSALSGNYQIGGIVGYADQISISNAVTTGIVEGKIWVGGIAGQIQYSDIIYSHTSGNISSNETGSDSAVGRVGGIAGGSNSLINQSYSTGTIYGQTRVGGLVGVNGEGSEIINSYATGSVTGQSNLGGLVGRCGYGTINNSYSVGSVNPTNMGSAPSNFGGLLGRNQSNCEVNNSFWDTETSGQSSSALGTGKTTEEMKTLATYKDASWNFDNVWNISSSVNDGYPNLSFSTLDTDGDGVPNLVENAGPNGGDANDDNIQDSTQPNVTTLANVVSGKDSLIQTTCQSNSSVSSQAESTATTDIAFNYPAGLLGFTTACPSVGFTATITIYNFGTFDPSTAVLRKYNSSLGTYTTIPGAAFSTVTIGGQTALKAVYSITDGGEFDQDGIANGVIVDPVGYGVSNTIAPNTGFGSI